MAILIKAADLARERGLDPKRLRAKLRSAGFLWHSHNDRWNIELGSDRHLAVLAVLDELTNQQATHATRPAMRRRHKQGTTCMESDEHYIIDLCDYFLKRSAIRQHRFDFLRGDSGRALPVDAWYPELDLVIEYREVQHTVAVPFFDRKQTVSGVGRGVQRSLYDQRRREVLPKHSITLVELDFSEFLHRSNRRLVRTTADKEVIAKRLAAFARLPQ